MTETPDKDRSYNIIVTAAVFLLGSFITFLNSTFMNVTLPDIMKELNISISTVQWISTGYMLATGIIVPFTAFLIDKFKTRNLFFIAMGLFTVGTIAGAFATIIAMIAYAGLILSELIIPMYLQNVKGFLAFDTGLILMPLTTSGLNTLERRLYAHGNAANNTLRQVAGSIGTSIIITIMSKASAASGIAYPIKVTVYGMNVSFACTGVLTFIGLIIAFSLLKRKKLQFKIN